MICVIVDCCLFCGCQYLQIVQFIEVLGCVVFICNECVECVFDFVKQQCKEVGSEFSFDELLSVKEIKVYFDEFVIGQDEVKKVFVVVVVSYYYCFLNFDVGL